MLTLHDIEFFTIISHYISPLFWIILSRDTSSLVFLLEVPHFRDIPNFQLPTGMDGVPDENWILCLNYCLYFFFLWNFFTVDSNLSAVKEWESEMQNPLGFMKVLVRPDC